MCAILAIIPVATVATALMAKQSDSVQPFEAWMYICVFLKGKNKTFLAERTLVTRVLYRAAVLENSFALLAAPAGDSFFSYYRANNEQRAARSTNTFPDDMKQDVKTTIAVEINEHPR